MRNAHINNAYPLAHSHRRLRANARARCDVAGRMVGLCVCEEQDSSRRRASRMRVLIALAQYALFLRACRIHSPHRAYMYYTHPYIHNRADTRLHYKLFTHGRVRIQIYCMYAHNMCIIAQRNIGDVCATMMVVKHSSSSCSTTIMPPVSRRWW